MDFTSYVTLFEVICRNISEDEIFWALFRRISKKCRAFVNSLIRPGEIIDLLKQRRFLSAVIGMKWSTTCAKIIIKQGMEMRHFGIIRCVFAWRIVQAKEIEDIAADITFANKPAIYGKLLLIFAENGWKPSNLSICWAMYPGAEGLLNYIPKPWTRIDPALARAARYNNPSVLDKLISPGYHLDIGILPNLHKSANFVRALIPYLNAQSVDLLYIQATKDNATRVLKFINYDLIHSYRVGLVINEVKKSHPHVLVKVTVSKERLRQVNFDEYWTYDCYTKTLLAELAGDEVKVIIVTDVMNPQYHVARAIGL